MRKKNIIILGLLLLQIPLICFGKNWDKVSEQIRYRQKMTDLSETTVMPYLKITDKKRSYGFCRDEENVYDEFRRSTKMLNRFLNKDLNSDTIFILEEHSDGSTSFLGSEIWNKTERFSYGSVDNGKTYKCSKYPDPDHFPDPQDYSFELEIKLISEWNLQKILDIVGNKWHWFGLGPEMATRIIIEKGKVKKIDCFLFKPFPMVESK